MDPLYPFTPEAVSALNAASRGNPRTLLKFADHLIDNAVKLRSIGIDEDLVKVIFDKKESIELLYSLKYEDH